MINFERVKPSIEKVIPYAKESGMPLTPFNLARLVDSDDLKP